MKPFYCLIPARGGSKRFPRKNIALLKGKPLITYPIQAAKASGVFTDVIVSTEDAEIASIAKKAGATIFPRPAALAEDKVSVTDVALHLLDELELKGAHSESLCVLYPTAALVTAQDIQEGLKQFQREKANSLMVITRFTEPPVWALREVQGFFEPAFPEGLRQSQALPTYWVDIGYFYFIQAQILRQYHDFYVPRMSGYQTNRLRAVDINEPEDLKLVEALMSMNGDPKK
jgi:pseudaminic acid cytidylyltransferase